MRRSKSMSKSGLRKPSRSSKIRTPMHTRIKGGKKGKR